MKAAVYRKNKGLVVEEISAPEAGDDGVLVRVSNTGFCGSDHSLIESGLLPDGIILGHETSGTVYDRGRQSDALQEGTRVIIRPTYCGNCRECLGGKPHLCGIKRRSIGVGDLPGGFAEYVRAFPAMLIPIPPKVDSRNAALAEAFASALHGIRRAENEGGSVLVMGGGPIGLAAVRILKILGFHPVVLSEPVEKKRELGKRFGADFVLDPLKEDISRQGREWTGGIGFDTILECSGVPHNVSLAFTLVAKAGTISIVSMFKGLAVNQPMALNFKEPRLNWSYSNTHEENIQCLNWMAAGKIDAREMITDLIPLEELPRVYRQRIHPGETIKVMLKIGEEF
ncbi:MAG: alcohol dehydrogenase catalytic domain-containing protein [Syntrophaceae bacterium]|nr:alcohol dehydrogenase catalytic domain-containing protein [Syntrophaceae bacterium]